MSRKPLVPHWSIWIVHLAWILVLLIVALVFFTYLMPVIYGPDSDAGGRFAAFALVYLLAAPLTLGDAIAGGVVWSRCRRRGQPAHFLWKILTLAAVAVLLAMIINLVI